MARFCKPELTVGCLQVGDDGWTHHDDKDQSPQNCHSFSTFRDSVPNGALSFFYRLDFNFNQMQDDLMTFCSHDDEIDVSELSIMDLRYYLNPTRNGLAKNICRRMQTTVLITMPPMVISQYSPKTGDNKTNHNNGNKRPGAGAGEHDAKRNRTGYRDMGDRVDNGNVNQTLKNYHFTKTKKIFAEMRRHNSTCPKLGQFSICGKYHVRGWCNVDCFLKSTHIPLPAETEKVFNKFCHKFAED
jgi:hypothetical protein